MGTIAGGGAGVMHRRQFGQSFHHALLACIREGRAPSEREIEQVAAGIWRDAFAAITGLDWSDVEIGSWYERRTLAAARAACGVATAAELAEGS